MLTADRIVTMDEAEMDKFLKTLFVRYMENDARMDTIDIVNRLMNLAINEGIMENPNDHLKDLVLGCFDRALTETLSQFD